MGYSLQANVKTLEGPQHPDRDEQFRYIKKLVSRFLQSKDPVLSVDTMKKELIGAFENRGRKWKRKGEADRVSVHDFPSMAEGKALAGSATGCDSSRSSFVAGADVALGQVRRRRP